VHATLASSPEGVHTKQRARRTCACLPEVIMLFPDAATLAFLALVYFLVFRPRSLMKPLHRGNRILWRATDK
jgi:hypothetical protein